MAKVTLGATGSIAGWEVSSTWSSSEFTVGHTTEYARVTTYSLGVNSASAQTGYVTSTQDFGDLSAYTGAASGAPINGCCGIWLYQYSSSIISAMVLRIGSGASDYTEATGAICDTATGNTAILGWNYWIFPLAAGSETGTPDWTNTDYARLSITFDSSSAIYLDYFTISSQDDVGLNGLGLREMQQSETSLSIT